MAEAVYASRSPAIFGAGRLPLPSFKALCGRTPASELSRGVAPAPGVSVAANNRETGTLAELKWQDLIRDEELSKLIDEALAHNFDSQIAAARVLEARAQLTV